MNNYPNCFADSATVLASWIILDRLFRVHGEICLCVPEWSAGKTLYLSRKNGAILKGVHWGAALLILDAFIACRGVYKAVIDFTDISGGGRVSSEPPPL